MRSAKAMKIPTFMAVAMIFQMVALTSTVTAATLNVDQANVSCNDVTGLPVYCTVAAAAVDANLTAAADTINVAAGTYTDAITLSASVSIIGAGAATTSLTGGIGLTGTWDGLLLDGLTLSGHHGAGFTNAVISSSNSPASFVGDYSLLNSVLDCGWDGSIGGTNVGRAASYKVGGGGGDLVWDNNEIKNCGHWYVADNTGSACPASVTNALDSIIFTNNHVHDVAGTISWRGKRGFETPTAVVSGNTFNYTTIAAGTSQAWAALELTNALDLAITGNVAMGVEGNGFQIWSEADWIVDISCNVITDNNEGIWMPVADGLGSCELNLYAPSGSVTGNTFSGNSNFGLSMIPDSGSNTGILDAENNYWGAVDGPSGEGTGLGDAVGTSIEFTPFLTSSLGSSTVCSCLICPVDDRGRVTICHNAKKTLNIGAPALVDHCNDHGDTCGPCE